MLRHKILLRFLAIVLSGLMVAALVPPFDLEYLAWVCLFPLILALWKIDNKNPARLGFLMGWSAGFIAFGIQLFWLTTVSWLGPILLAGYLAVFFGIFGAFAATLGNPWRGKKRGMEQPWDSLHAAFTHAGVFAGLEWLRGWLFTGFSWNGLGIAFHDTLVLSQAADLLGVCGLSFMLVFFQCVLIQVGHRMLISGADGIKRPRWDFTVTVMGIAMVVIYGVIRISTESNKESFPLKALLVQLNIPHEAARVLWTAEEVHMAYEEETLTALEKIAEADEKKLQKAITNKLEGEISLDHPDWVLWPESALHGRLIQANTGEWGAWHNNIDTISRVRENAKFDLIYGVVEIEGEMRGHDLHEKTEAKIFNSIAHLSTDDELQTYRKHHLVIFGETIPFVDSVPLLKKIYEQQSGASYQGSFSAGDSFEPMSVMLRGKKIGIIPSVCFEDTVPRLTRKFVRNEPQIIVNLTNDGWFKQSPAAAQHFANARFRAIELRRPMLRCANTGISAAIDSTGTTSHPFKNSAQEIRSSEGTSFLRGSLLTELRIPLEPSFSLYAKIGDWGIILLSSIGVISSFYANKKPESSSAM